MEEKANDITDVYDDGITPDPDVESSLMIVMMMVVMMMMMTKMAT